MTALQIKWLRAAGWICVLLQMLVALLVWYDFRGPFWSDLEVIVTFIGFPIGFGLGIAFVLLRRWLTGIIFLGTALGFFKFILVIAAIVQPIP